MTHAPGRSPRFVLTALALTCVVLASCHEDSVAPKSISTPEGPMGDFGSYVVDVDLKTRTVTTHPIASGSLSAPKGVSAAFYGGPGSITHNFSVEPSPAHVYVLRDRIENDLPFAIGTHAIHTLGTYPQDTMGVYVFQLVKPVVTECSGAPATCTVTADTAFDGTYPFTGADPQPYMYFKTILEAADPDPLSGLDYSDQSSIGGVDYSRTIGFHATANVVHFFFEIAVSAAWVRPHDQPWVVRYPADSMPNRLGTSLDSLRSEPDWRFAGLGVVDTSIATSFCPNDADRCLRLQNIAADPSGTPIDSIVYFRSDSIGPADTAFIQADVVTSGLKPGDPSVFFGMQDGVKAIHFGLSNGAAGFTNDQNNFIAGGSVSGSTTAANWRIAKFASDSVMAFKDGTKFLVLAYTALPAAPAPNARNAYFWFGQRVKGQTTNNPTNVASAWRDLTYSIRAFGP